MLPVAKIYQYKGFQYAAIATLSLLMVIMVVGQHTWGYQPYQAYFGATPPLLVFSLAIITGVGLLHMHLTNGWFWVISRECLRGLGVSTLSAVLFGITIIIVDLLATFPQDLNVSFPQSLLFYPSIGFVVEVVFHLLPLTIMLGILSLVFNTKKVFWPVLILISLLEPAYQASLGLGGQLTTWRDLYVVMHIFFINLVQLWLFKRYDFLSMYFFRVVYYLLWHVGWGYLRLQLLF